jgi:hypothetical protein
MDKVLELRNSGCTYREMCRRLHFNPVRYTAQLIEEGATKDRRNKAENFALDNLRVQMIIAMKKERATLQQIGDKLGLTRERARQLIKKVVATHGSDVFLPEVKTFWTVPEAADVLGIKKWSVSSACRKGKIPFVLRGKIERLITQEGMAALRRYFSKEATCSICGNKFTRKSAKKEICYNAACRKVQRNKWLSVRLSDKAAMIESLNGWRKALWRALQKNVIGENETWITFSQAVEISGLHRFPVSYLRKCGLISARLKPETSRTKKENRLRSRVGLYSLSEMKIAREIAIQFGLVPKIS